MDKPSFSFVLIARQEAKTLPRLLASLEEFKARGGTTVVVDTGSTDNTAQIARDWGCIVEEVGKRFLLQISEEEAKAINERFCVEGEEPVIKAGDRQFDFASARNYANSLSPTNLCWSPDPDEVFTKLDLDAVEKAIADGADALEYEFIFSHSPDGLPLIRFRHSKMFDRTKFSWSNIVHEILSGEGKRVYLPESSVLLEHFQNHETNRSGYLRGLAIDCFNNPDKDRQSHYFAREAFYTGRYKTAIKEFQRHISMNRWPAERSQSAVFMGDCYMALGKEEDAIRSWHEAISINSERREPWLKLAEHYYRKGDALRTAAYCEASLVIHQSGFYADKAEHYRHVPHEWLYWAYYRLGNVQKATKHFDEALAYIPTNPKYLHDYRFFHPLPSVSFVVPTLGRPEGLQRCLDSIKALNYPQELLDVCVLDAPEPTVPQKVSEGATKTKGEWIVYAANDTEFTPDSLMIAYLSSIENQAGLIAFHSEELLPDRGNAYAHFIIRRDLLPSLEDGEIFSTRYTHCAADNWLGAQCEKLGVAHHEEKAIIKHNHFSHGAEWDWVYERGWSHAEEDRATLKKDLERLAASESWPSVVK